MSVEEVGDVLGAMLSVAVDGDDMGESEFTGLEESCLEGGTLSPVGGEREHERGVLHRGEDGGGVVGGTVVDDDDIRQLRLCTGDDIGEGGSVVECGDDDTDVMSPSESHGQAGEGCFIVENKSLHTEVELIAVEDVEIDGDFPHGGQNGGEEFGLGHCGEYDIALKMTPEQILTHIDDRSGGQDGGAGEMRLPYYGVGIEGHSEGEGGEGG